MSRRLQFPPPSSYSVPGDPTTGPWGLADFVVERTLSRPELFSSTESCDRVTMLLRKFRPLRGQAQMGRSVMLTDAEHEFLKAEIYRALAHFAGKDGILPPHLVEDFAVYMRAVHAAEPATDLEVEGATAHGGSA